MKWAGHLVWKGESTDSETVRLKMMSERQENDAVERKGCGQWRVIKAVQQRRTNGPRPLLKKFSGKTFHNLCKKKSDICTL